MRAARSRSPSARRTSAASARWLRQSRRHITHRANASVSRSPMAEKAALLVELRTEELPPKSLRALSEVFAERVLEALARARLAGADAPLKVYATPRRLAFSIAEVAPSAAGRETEVTGPSAAAAAQAIAGFARKHGLSPEQLERRDTPKGPVMRARVKLKAAVLYEMLPGERVGPGSVLGIAAGRSTAGHRFMGSDDIGLRSADEYATRLEGDGKVIASFAARRAEIDRQLKAAAVKESADLGGYADLLGEVTALVEFPRG